MTHLARSAYALVPAALASAVCAVGALAQPPSVPAPSASAATRLPRLYSGVTKRHGSYVDDFRVRPRKVQVACAYGGEFVVSWSHWSRRSAAGVGHTRPCRGEAHRLAVRASRPIHGYFTRLAVRWDAHTTSRLGLGTLAGSVDWIELDWMADPASGASPWPA